MNLYVTRSATRVLRILVVRWTGRLIRSDSMVHAVARQAQVIHATKLQHSRIRGSMWNVTRYAAVSLNGSVFEGKWTLLIGVTLQTCRISSDREPRLFQFKATVRIVAVAASHSSFQHLVMGRHHELMFDFIVTAQAKLRFADSQ